MRYLLVCAAFWYINLIIYFVSPTLFLGKPQISAHLFPLLEPFWPSHTLGLSEGPVIVLQLQEFLHLLS